MDARSFSLYLTEKWVMEDKQKRVLLLHAAGIDVQEIYLFIYVGEQKRKCYTFEETIKVLGMIILFQSQMWRLRGIYSGRSHRLLLRRWTNL